MVPQSLHYFSHVPHHSLPPNDTFLLTSQKYLSKLHVNLPTDDFIVKVDTSIKMEILSSIMVQNVAKMGTNVIFDVAKIYMQRM